MFTGMGRTDTAREFCSKRNKKFLRTKLKQVNIQSNAALCGMALHWAFKNMQGHVPGGLVSNVNAVFLLGLQQLIDLISSNQ